MEWTSVLLSALFAGIVATAVTVAIEKWGGLVGGLLGTVPSTIVPAGIGMYVAGGEDVLVVSMAVVPLGMLLNALFLGAWVVVPRWFPGAPYLLVLTAVGALAFWTLLGMVFLVVVDELTGTWTSASNNWQRPGWCSCSSPPWCSIGRTQPTPKGTNRVSTLVLVARGVMAGHAIGIAVGFSGLGYPLLAGLASVFPAIFLTSMVALWLAQGPTVPQGAAGPMMLGGASVAVYANVAMWSLPGLRRRHRFSHRLVWLGVGWSLPAFLVLRQASRLVQRLMVLVQRGAAGMSTTST